MKPAIPGKGTRTQATFNRVITSFFLACVLLSCQLRAQVFLPKGSLPPKYKVDHRVDNMGYWKRMAELGLVPVAPPRKVPPAVFKSSRISDASVATSDSPDVPVTGVNSTQSENSVFVDPDDRFTLLNSNNSSDNPYPGYFLGADALFSHDGGENWEGQVQGAGGYNMGDPSTAINSDGRWFVGFIHSGGGQALAYSNNEGATWKVRAIAAPPDLLGGLLDKSHLYVDNTPTSPYKGNMYDGWTVITGPDDGRLQVSRSTDHGLAWQIPVTISDSVHALSHNQGINISTGPGGEVYAVWSIYDHFPGDENAIGFARSFNGGQTWEPARRIRENIKGIRNHGVTKQMRVNSFPCMAVDNSNSPWRGTIYIVWANVNYPGVNTGHSMDVYMMRSADNGATWTEPVRINQDEPRPGKQHFFPWICCDPANGNLAAVFYDDRDTPPEQAETWVATSTDGGENWQDFRVSDVAFTPLSVTGFADEYFGDYLGITALNGRVYPVWTDNRSGVANSYVSPFRLGPEPGQPYVAYLSNQVNDTLTGNGNGQAEYGETFALNLKVRNMGDYPDSAMTITLRSLSPFVTVTDSLEQLESLGAGQSSPVLNGFTIRVADSVPNQTRLMFEVRVHDVYDSTFVSCFTIRALAPEVRITDLLVDDIQTNNSHSLDPGEHCRLVVRLENPTAYPATEVSCSLLSEQPYVTVASQPHFLPLLQPGEILDIPFETIVDSVRAGTPASFEIQLSFFEQNTVRRYYRKIGLLFDDWESGDLEKFNWISMGNSYWVIDSVRPFEGKYCVRSGVIGDNGNSLLSLQSRALTYDSISFYRKVSTEERFDFLNFYIDDKKAGQWSGDLDWERVVFPVVPGRHQFKWEYAKDQGVVVGLDAVFIDFIELPSIQYTSADAGPDATIYECQKFTCNGDAAYYESLQWTTTGTGIFTDPGIPRPGYTPGKADKEAGWVTLILKAVGSAPEEIAIDSMNLFILPQPTAYAGPDAKICPRSPCSLASASATNYNSLVWTTSGTGKFDDITALHPVYSSSLQDSANGFVDLVLTSYAGNNDACGYVSDTVRITFFTPPVIPLEYRYRRCTGYSAELDATSPGGAEYLWQPGGEATAAIRVDSSGIGEGKKVLMVTVTGENGCVSTRQVEVIFTECTEKLNAGEVYFRVFPIPAKNECYVEFFTEQPASISYEIANQAGTAVRKKEDLSIHGQWLEYIPLKGFAQGTYIFTVRNGNSAAGIKIIVL